MPETELFLRLFALYPVLAAADRLEDRMKRFLDREPTTESLDGAAFAQLNGSGLKADYLQNSRRIVTEMKTVNGNTLERIERRLRDRLSQPDAPRVRIYGKVPVSSVIENMPDRDKLNEVFNAVSGRAVRKDLKIANEQIRATKGRLRLDKSTGLVIVINDSVPGIDAAQIAHAIKYAINSSESGYPDLSHFWVNIECHCIRLPDGGTGYPQVLISRSSEKPNDVEFLRRLIGDWAEFNGSHLASLNHDGTWDSLRPVPRPEA
ncbi:hypothetical protein [Inquilinus sp. OTU3971]|uniref:hypothetical protein n=1 Tax=Inquilinus sp. OTU3971 TaxID=3043855 RepID=UPI00313CF7DD